MTKEEIQRVLALSLEYYKSEVFGTNKESEKPSSERIDWIYDKMKGSSEIPNDLEEAAKKYAHCPFTDDDGNFHEDAFDVNAYHDFIAGYNLCKEQMMKKAWDTTVHLEPGANPIVTIGVGRFGLKVRDKVRVIVLPKEEEK